MRTLSFPWKLWSCQGMIVQYHQTTVTKYARIMLSVTVCMLGLPQILIISKNYLSDIENQFEYFMGGKWFYIFTNNVIHRSKISCIRRKRKTFVNLVALYITAQEKLSPNWMCIFCLTCLLLVYSYTSGETIIKYWKLNLIFFLLKFKYIYCLGGLYTKHSWIKT